MKNMHAAVGSAGNKAIRGAAEIKQMYSRNLVCRADTGEYMQNKGGIAVCWKH